MSAKDDSAAMCRKQARFEVDLAIRRQNRSTDIDPVSVDLDEADPVPSRDDRR